ncbi:AMP-binding protein [Chamaesiphon sp. VAR_48_metabat_403]|uniref:AMP-binding protein n=1 Tax=Chamaesiphon sp. VAR_48_metabat_403 TaxID=2964700 RepID=UPI00286E2256|nr:AMP-binding protein [Chamaesiphon sp. VAR_48_metabat_403]
MKSVGGAFRNENRAIFNSLDRAAIGEWVYHLCIQRLMAGWLVGIDGRSIVDLADRQLAKFRHSQPHFISIATPDPIEFIAAFMAGSRLGLPIFLGNPRWGITEREKLARLTARVDSQQHRHLIMIPTGGSSGAIKLAMHSWETLGASVWGFQEFYEVATVNCVCTLPLYHVSGLMQLCRSLLTDGKLFIIDLHQLDLNPALLIDRIEAEDYFISLVPTQLSKLLDLNASWLARMRTILVGGAPPRSELLTRARVAKLPLALTYGMTETGSQITSLKPSEFLAGNNSCGVALPHVKIKLLAAANIMKKSQLVDRVGTIQIAADSLMLGYFPDLNSSGYFEPDDVGTIDEHGYLNIVGRSSSKIITGGENVFPIEVVDIIMATGLVADVWVMGIPDRYWGQAVTAVYVANNLPASAEILSQAIAGKISSYKLPKYWIAVDRIPRNALGKILDRDLTKIVGDLIGFNL